MKMSVLFILFCVYLTNAQQSQSDGFEERFTKLENKLVVQENEIRSLRSQIQRCADGMKEMAGQMSQLSRSVFTNEAQTIDVRSYSCDQHTYLDSVLYLEWLGSNLPDHCKYKITKDSYTDNICVYAEVFNVSNPDAEIEYHEHLYTSYFADKKFNSHTRPYGNWCTPASTMVISFQSSNSSDHVKLKVFIKKDEAPSPKDYSEAPSPKDYSESSTSGGVSTGGVIVAVVVVVSIICGVLICVAARRTRPDNMASRTEYAYHRTSPGGVTIQTGPNPQTPYQPQAVAPGQVGYTFLPPHAAYPVGTNQPTGYHPQQAGYVLPPGGYYEQGTNQATVYPVGNIPPPVQGVHRPSPQPSPRAMHESIPSAPPDPSASYDSRYDPPPYPGY